MHPVRTEREELIMPNNHIVTYHEREGKAQMSLVSYAKCSCGKWTSIDHRGGLDRQRGNLQKAAREHLKNP